MTTLRYLFFVSIVLALSSLSLAVESGSLSSAEIPVRYPEGTTHGFLVLRDVSGKALAGGDLIQTVRQHSIVSRLVFHFRDGSLDDETTVFSQDRRFRLISDHHVQKGPAYPKPLDALIDVPGSCVTIRSTDGGKSQVKSERMQLPSDLANGMILYFLKNMPTENKQMTAHYVVFTPKPRLVKLTVSEQDKETFEIANVLHKARHFDMKIDLGGIAGVVAPLVGKAPADVNLWIEDGIAPGFIRMEGQLYDGGPIWSVEMSAVVWPKARRAAP